MDVWWIGFLPPAWFAAFDDALSGRGSAGSWVLAALGLAITGIIIWLAFGKLAQDYQGGLQSLGEANIVAPKAAARRRWLARLVTLPPLCWWLRDPVVRASFQLSAAYLLRDRDVKLRVYPSLAPMMVMPLVFFIRSSGTGGFGIAFCGAYLGLVPMLGLSLLQYSQQWQASDLFRAAPLSGPVQLCEGARRAVICFLALPTFVIFALLSWFLPKDASQIALLLPGLIAAPVYALYPVLVEHCVPLSMPAEEAKSSQGGLKMIGVMLISFALAGLALWAWTSGWFLWFLSVEAIIVAVIYYLMRAALAGVPWRSIE
jgi:hypothetical protein